MFRHSKEGGGGSGGGGGVGMVGRGKERGSDWQRILQQPNSQLKRLPSSTTDCRDTTQNPEGSKTKEMELTCIKLVKIEKSKTKPVTLP
jgi:hypothetical protein